MRNKPVYPVPLTNTTLVKVIRVLPRLLDHRPILLIIIATDNISSLRERKIIRQWETCLSVHLTKHHTRRSNSSAGSSAWSLTCATAHNRDRQYFHSMEQYNGVSRRFSNGWHGSRKRSPTSTHHHTADKSQTGCVTRVQVGRRMIPREMGSSRMCTCESELSSISTFRGFRILLGSQSRFDDHIRFRLGLG